MNCFTPDPQLPSTPTSFNASLAHCDRALIAALGLLGAFNLLPAAYASENAGELFQHLTIHFGTGKDAQKSRDELRGHTDAVYHALPNENRVGICSVSPDFVVLVGLRNPADVATRIIPISRILGVLTPTERLLLEDPVFDVNPQQSFVLQNANAIEYGVPVVVHDPRRGVLMRYSNNCVVADDAQHPQHHAVLQRISNLLSKPPAGFIDRVVVRPGDVVFINNRVALHGRDRVGGDPPGGQTRWLLRTYGIYTGSSPLHSHAASSCVYLP